MGRKLFAALLLFLCMKSLAAMAAAGEAMLPIAAGRQIVELSQGWRFSFAVPGDAPVAVGFDDGGWERVSVPHTWNRIGEYRLQRSEQANNKQGAGWYRLKVQAPAAAKRARQYLEFAAVGNVADVWVNGIHVGQQKGAFSRFRFDVTPHWKPGATNLIVVRADNSKREIGSSTEDVIPLAGDFFIPAVSIGPIFSPIAKDGQGDQFSSNSGDCAALRAEADQSQTIEGRG